MNDFIRTIIEANAPLSYERIIKEVVDDFTGSPNYQLMVSGKNYYKNNNDISKKKRYNVINGVKVENNNLANTKLSHPFLRDLTDQKVQYLLSNDWSVDNENFAAFLNDNNRKVLERVAKDSIVCGIGWLFVGIKDNEITIERKDPLNIIPVWGDEAHTQLDAVVNQYTQIEYVASTKKTVAYVEWWDKDGVKTYKDNDGTYVLIEDNGHLTDGVTAFNWDKVPFIAVKYNDDEISLLQSIKSLVDEYDDVSSTIGDNLKDTVDKVKVVSGAMGTDIKELANNLKNYKLVSLPEGGDFKEVGTSAEVTATLNHLEQLKKDIFYFGRGVDPTIAMGANASGEARRFLYAALDLDCNQLETGILTALQQLVWFLNAAPTGGFNIPEDVTVNFSRNMIINTAEVMDVAVKAQGITGITRETVLSLLPFIDDPIKELQKWEQQNQEEIKKMQNFVVDDTFGAEGDGDMNNEPN